MEHNGNDDENSHNDYLHDESCLHENVAQILALLRKVGIRELCDAKCAADFDEKGEGAKGGERSAGMEGRVIRHIVKDPSKDVVIGKFKDGSWG